MRMVLHCSGIKALDKPNVFPDRDFCGPFSLFSLCSGYPAFCLLRNSKFPDFFSYFFNRKCVTVHKLDLYFTTYTIHIYQI